MSVAVHGGVLVPGAAVLATLAALTPVPLSVHAGMAVAAVGILGAALLAVLISSRRLARLPGGGYLARQRGEQLPGPRSGSRS